MTLGEYFNIDFNGEMLSCHRFYHDESPVKIVEKIKHTQLGIDKLVKINDNGKESTIEINKLKIPFYLKE